MTGTRKAAPRGNGRQGAQGTKAEFVANQLRHEIAAGMRAPGSNLPTEARVLEQFGISRATHREALRMLETDGLIRVSRGAHGGAKIGVPTTEAVSRLVGVYLQMHAVRLEELFDMRLNYEPAAVRAITRRRDQVALRALAQCVAGQEYSLHDRAAFSEHETQFRRLLLEHAGNPVLKLVGSILENIYEQHMVHVAARLPELTWENDHKMKGVRAKQHLVKVMAQGSADQAERIWTAYIKMFARRLFAVVRRDSIVEYFARDGLAAENPVRSPD
jgi:DNA-binding FadR family transcriptional regulator